MSANPYAECPDCDHIHTPEGCTGPPSPSDLWAGVSPEGCDCDAAAEATLAKVGGPRHQAPPCSDTYVRTGSLESPTGTNGPLF